MNNTVLTEWYNEETMFNHTQTIGKNIILILQIIKITMTIAIIVIVIYAAIIIIKNHRKNRKS